MRTEQEIRAALAHGVSREWSTEADQAIGEYRDGYYFLEPGECNSLLGALADALAEIERLKALIESIPATVADSDQLNLRGDAEKGLWCGVEDGPCRGVYSAASYGYNEGVDRALEHVYGVLGVSVKKGKPPMPLTQAERAAIEAAHRRLEGANIAESNAFSSGRRDNMRSERDERRAAQSALKAALDAAMAPEPAEPSELLATARPAKRALVDEGGEVAAGAREAILAVVSRQFGDPVRTSRVADRIDGLRLPTPSEAMEVADATASFAGLPIRETFRLFARLAVALALWQHGIEVET